MLSALLMFRRALAAIRYAIREEAFVPVLSAGAVLIFIGTLTLTTTSVADPDLVLEDGWLKIFTVLYQLIGIGILVEILRRLGRAFVEVQAHESRAAKSGPAP